MKTTNKTRIIRNVTAAAALAIVGFAPVADAAPKASLNRGGLSPQVSKPVIELLGPSDSGRFSPAPLPFPRFGVKATKRGSTLNVRGNAAANDVTIAIDDSNANRVYVYDDGSLIASFKSSPIKKIVLELGGGNDTFFVGLAPAASHKFTKRVDVDLGAGDDSGFVDFRGTTSNAIVQGTLKVNVTGGNGNDEVYAHFARKHGGKLGFKCQMGGGQDDCSASMWGDVTGGADVKFALYGNGGADHLWSWNTYDQKDGAYADIRITGDSTMAILMDGGSSADTLTPTYAGEADGSLTVEVKGRTGSDTSNGVVALAGSSSGQVDAKTFGHAGNDDLTLNVTGSTPYLTAKIDGGLGSDLCQSTPNVSKTSCP